MGQMQQQVTTLEGARAAGKSVVENSHDEQKQHGIKQNFVQNVTNQKQVSGTVKGADGAGSCCFGQVRTGSKKY